MLLNCGKKKKLETGVIFQIKMICPPKQDINGYLKIGHKYITLTSSEHLNCMHVK